MLYFHFFHCILKYLLKKGFVFQVLLKIDENGEREKKCTTQKKNTRGPLNSV